MAGRTSPEPSWDVWREEFPVFRHAVYLNTCSLAALSTRVAGAVHEALARWDHLGSAAWAGPWWERIAEVRQRTAAVLGAQVEEIALFPNVTAALVAAASALDYGGRPRVVVSELEFPTTRYLWQTAGAVDAVTVRSDGLTVPLEAYEEAVDGRTALVVGSHVYFTSGMVQDIAALAALSHAHGAYCLVDAYQSVGQVPVDVRAAQVDFLVGGGLKWLLGGPGIAFLYVRRELIPHLRPRAVGWFAHRSQFGFEATFAYADDARRFEGGTPSITAVYAQAAGLRIVQEIGVERLRARQLNLVGDLVARARDAGLRPRVPEDLGRHAGIVTVPRADPSAVVRALADRGIIADARPGVVRLSPYFYNVPGDHERVVRSLADLGRAGLD